MNLFKRSHSFIKDKMTLNKEKSIGDVESPGSLNLSDDFVDVSPVPSVMSMASDCSSSYSLSSNDTAEDVADVLIEASLVENEQAADEAQDAGRRVGAGIAVGVVTMPFFGLVVAAMAGVAASYGATQPGVSTFFRKEGTFYPFSFSHFFYALFHFRQRVMYVGHAEMLP